eukprot:TRINITY_DN27752_c0_g1_i1.p1 TRINITY_DN27752_c0_g1~~TRINITY_DN27752_c0_g1_i1.p1  ORF type:complete len:796 (-),score=164.40 TRINITY_DN27752_c0_g1_i1:510-2633(-)
MDQPRARVLPAAPPAEPVSHSSMSCTGSRIISEADVSFPAFEDPGTSPAPLPRLAYLGGPGGGSCGSQARLRTPAARCTATPVGFAHHGSPQPAVPLTDHAFPGFGDMPDAHLGSSVAHSPRPSAEAGNSADSSWVPPARPMSQRPPSVPPVSLEAVVADPFSQPVLRLPAPPPVTTDDGAYRTAEPVANGVIQATGTFCQHLPPPPSAFGRTTPGNRSDIQSLPNGDVRRGRSRPESPVSDRRSWEALPPAPSAACWFAEKAEELQRRRGSSLPPAPRGGATSSWVHPPRFTSQQIVSPSMGAGVWPPPPLPPLSEELRQRLETLEVQRLAQLKAESCMANEIEELRTEVSTWKARCERLKADSVSAEASALASAKSETEARRTLQELEAECDRLRTLRETSERQCFDQASEVTRLREELRVQQKSRHMHEQLREEVEQQRSMRTETDRLRVEAVSECDRLREELARAKEDLHSMRQQSVNVELLQTQSAESVRKLREERDRLEASLRQKEASLRLREESHSKELHERETRTRLDMQTVAGQERDYKQKIQDLEAKVAQLMSDKIHLQKICDERSLAEGNLRESIQSEAQHVRAIQDQLWQSQESERRLREDIKLLQSENNELIARGKLAGDLAAARKRSTTPLPSAISAVSTAPLPRAESIAYPGGFRLSSELEAKPRHSTHLVVDLREDDNPLVDEMESDGTGG